MHMGQFFEELKRSEDYLEPLVHRFTLDLFTGKR